MQNKLSKKYFQAFTLVELIIVITILAVLATIAFVSFSKYTKSSRDATKLTTLTNIEKTLSIHYTQTSNYPLPREITLTGVFNTEEIFYQGNFTQEIAQLLNISKLPVDPITNTPYTYGVSKNKKYYQLATGLETQITQTNTPKIINTTYANFTQAKVVGNYKGLLLQEGKLYNIPSLIVTGTGNLTSNEVRFVVNKGTNVPTQTAQNINLPIQTLTGVLQSLGSSASTLTGLTLPCDKATFQSQSGTLSTQLGYPSEVIGEVLFGSKLYTNDNVKIGECGNVIPPQVPAGPLFQALCTANGQIIYTDNLGTEIGRVNNAGTTLSGNPGGLTISGHIVICSGNGTGYVIRSINEGATAVGATNNTAAYGNYYQWGRNDNGWTSNWSSDNWGLGGQGPCSIGYHVPTQSEWGGFISLWSGLNGLNLSNAFKLPFAGNLRFDTGILTDHGTSAYYWSSTLFNASNANYLDFTGGNNVYSNMSRSRIAGLPVRCFKD